MPNSLSIDTSNSIVDIPFGVPFKTLSASYSDASDIWNPSLSSTNSQDDSFETADTEYLTSQVVYYLQAFYKLHARLIKASHGLEHAMTVYKHARKAIECHQPTLSPRTVMEIEMAALLHDTDDYKYFPDTPKGMYPNALAILAKADVPDESWADIIQMISLVGCSENGNTVPDSIRQTNAWHKLIPRWSDRLEAVGASGVVRCFQYSKEIRRPLSSPKSPRAQTAQQVWNLCRPERFESYQTNGPSDDSMMTHYYDKLLHVSRPPPEIVQNEYLIKMAEASSEELVEMCVRFGKTGRVDEEYVQQLAKRLGVAL
ncbi:hypothetical protein ACA910_016660 [Epithemia clementina (nom. ined.)]